MKNRPVETVELTNGTKGVSLIKATIGVFTGEAGTNFVMGLCETSESLSSLIGKDNVEGLVADIEDAFNVFSDKACSMVYDLLEKQAKEGAN